jgi:hypothetical protein
MQSHRDHVDVGRPAGHGAMFAHPLECGNLVAQAGCTLEVQRLGGGFHGDSQFVAQLVGLALQHAHRIAHLVRVLLRRHQPDTGGAAALDLVLQAGPIAMGEEGVAAGTQQEQLLQRAQGFAHCGGRGERADVAVVAGLGAAVVADARKLVRGEADVGIALVVPVDDVVPRLLLLDQRRFQQQRLILGVGDRHLDAADLRDHALDP